MAQQLQSTTRMTTFKTLADTGALGQVLVRLMMAINDFGLANEALGGWMKEQPPKLVGRQPGAKMYCSSMIRSWVVETTMIRMAEERGRLSGSGNILDATASQLAQVGVGFCDLHRKRRESDQRLR
jgi:hypothetical protein